MTATGISLIGRFSMPHECDVQFSVRRRRSDDSSENEHIYIGQRFTMSHEGLAKNLEKTRSRGCPWRAQVVDDPRPSDEAADESQSAHVVRPLNRRRSAATRLSATLSRRYSRP
ncbi:unnamed protein product [Nippostrongylus brasiliensis]|uniref:Uncharacterized protein n=1 Tax=Nippostrongylus brasiliensis TaxID=27835 RepID=A0A0N4XWC2_NIPBR|nr:unnamed protein product [Nippostrongylus brasiliensis]